MNGAAGSPSVAADLPPLRLGGRAASVREVLAEGVEVAPEPGAEGNGSTVEPVDALVLTNLANGRWLTGFSGSAMVVVLTADDLLVITDGRYATQAPAELDSAGVEGRVVIANRGSEQQEAAAAAVGGLGRIALEADNVSWSRYGRFAGEWFAGAELVPSTGVIERLRRPKSPEEVARVAAAASRRGRRPRRGAATPRRAAHRG